MENSNKITHIFNLLIHFPQPPNRHWYCLEKSFFRKFLSDPSSANMSSSLSSSFKIFIGLEIWGKKRGLNAIYFFTLQECWQIIQSLTENKTVAQEAQSSVSLIFPTTFWRFSDLFLDRTTATRNLFVLYYKKAKTKNKKKCNVDDIRVCPLINHSTNQSKCVYNSSYHIKAK